MPFMHRTLIQHDKQVTDLSLPSPSNPILEVKELYKYFPIRQGLGLSWRKSPKVLKAVDGVDFTIAKGEVLALVGESGCGKTTIARVLIGLEEQTYGEILFKGVVFSYKKQGSEVNNRRTAYVPMAPGVVQRSPVPVTSLSLKRLRQMAQMIFQDPYESLNPRETIFNIVAEPLMIHGLLKDKELRQKKVKTALEEAGLRPAEDYYLRLPHELSGGQRQRVVIAAALVLEPELLLADEPVSMLDVSIRAEILNLLSELREKRGISVLFITHDFSTVGHFADRVAVMYLGRIVEVGTTEEILTAPQHPYTRALLSVVPVPNPRMRRERVILQGETPNPTDIPEGCRFQPRCPMATEECKRVDPPFVELSLTHLAACIKIGQPTSHSG
jgi:peptide/nickel transport system ATP-binding protein